MVIAVIISPGCDRVFHVRCVAGQQKEVVERDLPFAEMHDGVEGDERQREIARIGGNAGVARAENRMVAGDAADGGAAAAGSRVCCRPGRLAGSRK